MPVNWSTLEAIRGRAAVPVTWRKHLGDDFDLFRVEFLRRLPDPAQYYPCPIPCGCLSHRVVIHGDNDIVAVCECEPWDCDNIVLKNEDVAVYELDMPSLGRAVTKAFGFRPRYSDMGIPATLEIGAYTEQGIPVILTIRHDSDALHRGVSELVARLRAKFILVVPTIDLLKARTQELLNGVGAAVLSLEATVRMNAGGSLHTVKPPLELLSPIVSVHEPAPESVVGAALALMHKLDEHAGRKLPTHGDFFVLYCAKGLSISGIMAKRGCSRGMASKRKQRCEEVLKAPLDTFRQHGHLIDHLERQRRESNARYINAHALIEDDAGFENAGD